MNADKVYYFILNSDHQVLTQGGELPSTDKKGKGPDLVQLRNHLTEHYGLYTPQFLGSYSSDEGKIYGFQIRKEVGPLREFPWTNTPLILEAQRFGEKTSFFKKAYEHILLGGYSLPEKPFTIWRFGDNEDLANHLASLCAQEIKTGTSSLFWAYGEGTEPLPQQGDLSLIVDWFGNPACLIENVKVETLPFSKVTPEFASKEGEGDLSLEYWKKVHWEFFSDNFPENLTPDKKINEEMPVVTENFKVLQSFLPR